MTTNLTLFLQLPNFHSSMPRSISSISSILLLATNRHALRLQTISLLLVDSAWRHIRAGSSIRCTCVMNDIPGTVQIRMFEAEFLEGSGCSKYGRVQISYLGYMIIIIKKQILIIHASKLHLQSHISWSDFKTLCRTSYQLKIKNCI
jgi:hypothetical protein